MSVEGRIAVDVLFHDKDGTNAISVVSLQNATPISTGIVAVASGVVGTSAVSVLIDPTTYRDASGNVVSLTYVNQIVFECSAECTVEESSGRAWTRCPANGVSVLGTEQGGIDGFVVGPLGSGTATYTLVMYGS
jgi:hypothetical protein